MPWPRFTAIAAVDEGGVIGNEGKIPWQCDEDLAHFRSSTEGQVMVMGHKTFLSLPNRVLEGRISLVLSQNHFRSLAELKIYYDSHPELLAKRNFVIGGGSIFSLFFAQKLIDEAVITHIDGLHEGDVYFPLHYLTSWSKKNIRTGEGFSIDIYGS